MWTYTAAVLTQQPVASAHGFAYVAAETQLESTVGSDSQDFTDSTFKRLENLNLLSEGLIAKAGSGSSRAHEFRIEARMYRELLRQTMLSDRERPTNEQLPQPLLLDMVRMSALLHSAADCKTGFVITCPADLMLQLKSQQSKVSQALKMIQMMHE